MRVGAPLDPSHAVRLRKTAQSVREFPSDLSMKIHVLKAWRQRICIAACFARRKDTYLRLLDVDANKTCTILLAC